MNINQLRMILVAQRRAIGWSQEKLAERSNVSVRTIRNIETGANKNPRRSSVELLLTALRSSRELAPGTEAFELPPPSFLDVGQRTDHPTLPEGAKWTGVRPRSNALVGRDEDLRHIVSTAQRGRLLVLTGPSGVGKTRLALTAAEHMLPLFRDGVAVVELGRLPAERDGAREAFVLVQRAVDAAIPVEPDAGADTHMLLVIDNAEHVVEAVSSLSQRLLDTYPGLQIIVTSLCPLTAISADVWDVAPLEVDGTGADLPAAVELFLDRARSTAPTLDLDDRLPLVRELCRRLDGLPLAIEMAAHRVRSVGLDVLLREEPILPILDQPTVGGISHNRPLSASVKWSYDQLDDRQRELLRSLSSLSGSFTIGRMLTSLPTTSVNLLTELVDASIVQVERGSEYEYKILGIVREYVDWLAASELSVPA